MPINPLSSLQAKLMRMLFDSGAAEGERRNALSMLLKSFTAEGRDLHELVDTLQNPNLATAEETPLPPVQTKPDYGLTPIPFGPLKGQLFMDTRPYQLRRLREWCQTRPDGTIKFRDLNAFLGDQAP